MATEKLIHTVVLDTGPIIKGDPSISTLLAQSEQLVTLPSVIQEIRDEATRTRLQTTLLPFLILKSPKESSIKIISDFARRTGDLSVLSRVDIHLLALTYDLECERNGGDWRLRKTPGEKRINGANPNAIPKSDPVHNSEPQQDQSSEQESDAAIVVASEQVDSGSKEVTQERDEPQSAEVVVENSVPLPAPEVREAETNSDHDEDDITTSIDAIQLSDVSQNEDSSDSDSEGWITPSNLKKKQEEDLTGDTSADPEPKVLQVALLTSDYAMQNVALQMNFNLLSPSLNRIRQLKTFVLRCHACFNIVKDTSKQFCPRCGKPSLTRVSCSTDQNGQFKLHLKKNMQWNTRGDRYSVPKPVAGASNGRIKGGGKGGWGNDLILAEDQKEYVRAMTEQKRAKQKDYMDEDYLPGILTGNRIGGSGHIKVGAGKTVNSRKRK